MIPNQWYVVLESNQVGQKPVGVIRMGEQMVFWRDNTNKVHCAIDRCPHRGIALSKGAIVSNHLQCPFHGFEYDESGKCVYIPANGRNGVIPKSLELGTYPTFESHGLIWIWWGQSPPGNLQPPKFFDNIDDSFVYASAQDPWSAHYSRVIENQLDVVHLPFIHRNTIGRGNRTLVDGPLVVWHEENIMHVYVYNRHDDGKPPRKPRELTVKDAGSVHLELTMPNLWQNYISPDVRIVAAFVPVDEEKTILYLRFYQRFMKLPALGKLITMMAMPFNIYVAHQDRRVVETHQPKASRLKMNEKLIQGDLPIIEYRKRRHALLEQYTNQSEYSVERLRKQ